MDKYLPFLDKQRMSIELSDWLTKLKSPQKYYEGRSFQKAGLPDNILLFSRLSPRTLEPSRPHHHHRYVLIFAWKGKGTLILNQHPLQLQPGMAVLIHPLQFHHYTDLTEQELHWLFITFEVGRHEDIADWRNQPVQLDERALTLLQQIAILWGSSGLAHEQDGEIPLALGWLLLHLANLARGQPRLTASHQGMDIFFRVEQWLSQHPIADWTLPSLASGLGMSERHLRRCFTTETCMGLGLFLQERRMLRAITVLRKKGRVSDAAEAGGYASLYVFSRAFRRMFQVSPREYMRQR